MMLATDQSSGTSAARNRDARARPLISVGLPVYNGARFVAQAIESVLGQDCADLELVICDNASTDGTEAICEDFARRDARVRYVRNGSNVGAMANFSRVFELSRGHYFRWLSADDYIGPGALSQCVAVLNARPEVVLCCTKVEIVDGTGASLRPYDEVQALEQPTALERFRAAKNQDAWCNAVYGVIRREALLRTRLMGVFGGSDAALLAELALHGRFAELPEPLFFRRVHEQAYSYANSPEQMRKFYAPQSRQKRSLILYTWRHLLDHWQAVGRAPLPTRERVQLRSHLLRMVVWNRRVLSSEILSYFSAWTQRAD
jgi:glycosyltransferase involved in cell wall biosynthesis